MFKKTICYLYGLIGILTILIPYLVWYYLGEDSYVLIHDNLDSELVYILKLLDTKSVLTTNIGKPIEGIMNNSLPRFAFRSGLNFTFILFYFLSPIKAYITNHLLVHLIGYIGMFLLLGRYFIKQKHVLVFSISIIFGLTSYYHIQYGISISGQPLLLFAFLNLLYKREKWFDWLIISLFPLYSFLFVTLPFFVPLLIILGIVHYFKFKRFSSIYWIGIFLLSIINLIVEFPVLYSILGNSNFVSHRTIWDIRSTVGSPSLETFFFDISNSIQSVHYHVGGFSTIPIIISLIIGVFTFRIRLTQNIKIVSLYLLFIIIWAGLYKIIVYTIAPSIQFLNFFNSERFYFLAPFFWLLFLAVVLNEFEWNQWVAKYCSFFLLFFTLKEVILKNKEFIENYKIVSTGVIREPTFRQFYDVDLFTELKNYISEREIENYSTISIGMYPSIAQYNGIKTLDSYQNNYDLNYKNQFRKIIKPELEKNQAIQSYFDNWGSRCYILSSELKLNFMFRKDSSNSINNLELNLIEMEKMNGKYIISALPINNSKMNDLTFLAKFSNPNSFRELFLYAKIKF